MFEGMIQIGEQFQARRIGLWEKEGLITTMRIVTYNINGLRTRLVPPRTLLSFLDSLESDIICFQETKISRQELSADIAVAEGYESFFSCTRTVKKGRIGYSGVATFCRISSAVPVAADEGFTGLLHASRTGEISGGKARVGCYEDVLNMEGVTRQELLQLDSEGRCLVTDHSSFVLFNIYGPHVDYDNDERFHFKMNFYQALQLLCGNGRELQGQSKGEDLWEHLLLESKKSFVFIPRIALIGGTVIEHRWEGLLKHGRRVIAVGDFNISPFHIDSCNPGPDFDANQSRQWLRSMLQSGGGSFLDVFRIIHPDRKEAYTCWSQASGAEEFNYGTRIDLIIAAGTCDHQALAGSSGEIEGTHSFAECEVEDCDILGQFKRFKADSLPRWVGGRNVKLEGSDHAPVFVQLKKKPTLEPHEVPPLAARFMPELRGRQQSIVSLLQKRPYSSHTTDSESSSRLKDVKLDTSTLKTTVVKSKNTKKPEVHKGKQQNLRSFFMPTLAVVKDKDNNQCFDQCAEESTFKSLVNNIYVDASLGNLSNSVGVEHQPLEYQDIEAHKGLDVKTNNSSQISSGEISQHLGSQEKDDGLLDATSPSPLSVEPETGKIGLESCTLELSQKSTATMEWQRIQKAMLKKVPLCKGHKEPCVVRVVRKAGPNLGRAFHVCARAQGPSSNPEARCDHFEWNTSSKLQSKK